MMSDKDFSKAISNAFKTKAERDMEQKVLIGCLVVILIFALAISVLATWVVHYALVQFFPTWNTYVLWGLSVLIAGFLLNAGRSGVSRSKGE